MPIARTRDRTIPIPATTRRGLWETITHLWIWGIGGGITRTVIAVTIDRPSGRCDKSKGPRTAPGPFAVEGAHICPSTQECYFPPSLPAAFPLWMDGSDARPLLVRAFVAEPVVARLYVGHGGGVGSDVAFA